jgi:hypothetical protein
MKCDRCKRDIDDKYPEDRCPSCNYDIGAPNVREVKDQQEMAALDNRYCAAHKRAQLNTYHDRLQAFDSSMKNTSAVINMKLKLLHVFITENKALYSTYGLQLSAHVRKPADSQDDKDRRVIEEKLFGSYGKEIRYAALSLDGAGLKSYGEFSVKLNESDIDYRSTLLEENSFYFFDNHGCGLKDPTPPGYRALWSDRNKLAVAKLADKINPGTNESDFAKILLYSEGKRETDRFIEVHIYGRFDNAVIEAVKAPRPKNKIEKVFIADIRETAVKAGKRWTEE